MCNKQGGTFPTQQTNEIFSFLCFSGVCVAINILRELVTTSHKDRYLLVISNRFCTPVQTVWFRAITAGTVAKAFVSHWVMVYDPSTGLLLNSGEQVKSRFFHHACKIPGIKNVFTATCHPQTSVLVECYNQTILARLCHYVVQHPTEWILYTDHLT